MTTVVAFDGVLLSSDCGWCRVQEILMMKI